MDIRSKRASHTNESTLAVLWVNEKPFGFVIEDEPREVKVKGETRIKALRYKLGIKKELTPLTMRYRKRFSWFKHHIELVNVPDFTNVYVHVGNDEGDTDACQVIGCNAHIDAKAEFRNSESVKLYKKFYELVYPILERGDEDVYWIIYNENEYWK